MTSQLVKSFLGVALVTTFALNGFAQQSAAKSQNETLVKKSALPAELKNLPLILDAKNIKADKFKNTEASSIKLDKLRGPGSGGGGGVCAMNITAATVFIKENLALVPFANQAQRDRFISKISSVQFLAGANLESKGQSVNAKNYPAYGIIVLDLSVCDELAKETSSGYSILLHEYLGVASIDDTTYQISASFIKKAEKLNAEEVLDLVGLREAAIKKFLVDANNSKTQLGKKISQLQEETKDGRNKEGSIPKIIARSDVQVVLADAQDIHAVWHYAEKTKNACIGEQSTATFKILLTWTSEVHFASELTTAEFEVKVRKILKMPILKNTQDLYCEDVFSPGYKDTFGKVTSTIEVTGIEFVK